MPNKDINIQRAPFIIREMQKNKRYETNARKLW